MALAAVLLLQSPAIELSNLSFHKLRGPLSGGAVLDNGTAGNFDDAWTTCPSVVFDGRRYLMWYSSVYDSKMGAGGIGAASSFDGVHWTRLNEGRPVLSTGQSGAFDEGQVLAPKVRLESGVYRMWYTGMAAQWHSSGIGFYRIGLAESRDGVHWKRLNGGKPVFDLGPGGSYDEVQVATPAILREGRGYRMWYAAWSPATGHTICVARSRDGLRWQRENGGKPVAGLPAGAYGPAIHREGDQYLLLFMAAGGRTRGLLGAISRDGMNWKMIGGGQPLLAPGAAGDFDDNFVGHAWFLKTPGSLRVWYTGHRREDQGIRGWRLRIGVAEARFHER